MSQFECSCLTSVEESIGRDETMNCANDIMEMVQSIKSTFGQWIDVAKDGRFAWYVPRVVFKDEWYFFCDPILHVRRFSKINSGISKIQRKKQTIFASDAVEVSSKICTWLAWGIIRGHEWLKIAHHLDRRGRQWKTVCAKGVILASATFQQKWSQFVMNIELHFGLIVPAKETEIRQIDRLDRWTQWWFDSQLESYSETSEWDDICQRHIDMMINVICHKSPTCDINGLHKHIVFLLTSADNGFIGECGELSVECHISWEIAIDGKMALPTRFNTNTIRVAWVKQIQSANHSIA